MESLLKKKSARGWKQGGEVRTADPSAPQELPAEPPPEASAQRPSPHEPSPREQPRIKTRETISAREGGDGAGPFPGERMERTRIKMREPVSGASSCPRTVASFDHSRKPPDRRFIKTRDTYVQRHPASVPEQSPQALMQGRQEFVRERSRAAVMKRAEARRGWNGGQGRYTQAVHRPTSPGASDSHPAREDRRTIIKTAHSERKPGEHAVRHAIKTVDCSAGKTIKTAQRTAKNTEKAIKTA